ncbi:uncharacterized protein [Ptychodera flava]|uniref:uncharacterized protein n=1 Tax=Ptychodera flava TaxID=63121 RepID=UPI00396A00F4
MTINTLQLAGLTLITAVCCHAFREIEQIALQTKDKTVIVALGKSTSVTMTMKMKVPMTDDVIFSGMVQIEDEDAEIPRHQRLSLDDDRCSQRYCIDFSSRKRKYSVTFSLMNVTMEDLGRYNVRLKVIQNLDIIAQGLGSFQLVLDEPEFGAKLPTKTLRLKPSGRRFEASIAETFEITMKLKTNVILDDELVTLATVEQNDRGTKLQVLHGSESDYNCSGGRCIEVVYKKKKVLVTYRIHSVDEDDFGSYEVRALLNDNGRLILEGVGTFELMQTT